MIKGPLRVCFLRLMPLCVFCALSVVTLATTVTEECPEWLDFLVVGDTTDVVVEEISWLGTETRWEHVYRLHAQDRPGGGPRGLGCGLRQRWRVLPLRPTGRTDGAW